MSLPPPPPLKPPPKPKLPPEPKNGATADYLTLLKATQPEKPPEADLPQEILDAPKSDLFEKIKCRRCEKLIVEEELESHMNSHSSEIFPDLYLGGQRNAYNKKELIVRTNVLYILNTADGVENIFRFCGEGCECTSGGPECNAHDGKERKLLFTYFSKKIKDAPGEDIFSLFDETFDIIESVREKNQRILVHCIAGVSRSASIVIAYCMRKNRWNLKTAFDYVKKARSIIAPIPYFVGQLQKYERVLFPETVSPSLTVEDVYPQGTIFVENSADVTPIPDAEDELPNGTSP